MLQIKKITANMRTYKVGNNENPNTVEQLTTIAVLKHRSTMPSVTRS